MVICNLCVSGVPLCRVRTHATSPTRTIRTPIDDIAWNTEIIPHGFRCPPEGQLKARVLDEVAQALGLAVEAVSIRGSDDKAWKDARTPSERRGPIAGLRQFPDGYVCLHCRDIKDPYCCLKISTMKHHLKTCLGPFLKDKRYKIGSVQSLSLDTGLVHYFQIPQGRTDETRIKETSGSGSLDDGLDAAALIRKSRAFIAGTTSTDRGEVLAIDERSLNAYLKQSGTYDFLQEFEHKDMVALSSQPLRRDKHMEVALRRLFRLVTCTFLADCRDVVTAHPSVLFSLANCAP
jgi:hypothetical protein